MVAQLTQTRPQDSLFLRSDLGGSLVSVPRGQADSALWGSPEEVQAPALQEMIVLFSLQSCELPRCHLIKSFRWPEPISVPYNQRTLANALFFEGQIKIGLRPCPTGDAQSSFLPTLPRTSFITCFHGILLAYG